MLFIDNKYTGWYTQIITNAKARITSGYTETHHTIPKSLGGTNDSENLVTLTAREHFVCHLLLTKMVSGESYIKMCRAAWMMTNCENQLQERYQVTSRQYTTLKERHAAIKAAEMSINNPMSNPAHRQKQAEAAAKRGKTKGTTGMKHTEETKQKMRDARLKQVVTEETRAKIAAIRTGTTASSETKAKMSAGRLGRKQPTRQCEHCKKIIAAVPYTRFHGNNCKNK